MLLESMIAISLITVIMAAIGAEYVSGLASMTRQRATQTAAQLADSALEEIRALQPDDLVTGRGATSVTNQFTAGTAVPTIAPWLQNMDPASDPKADPNAGAAAMIATCTPMPGSNPSTTRCTQQPSTVQYTVSQFLGTCYLVPSGTSTACMPAAQKTTGSVHYLRAVVAVGWTSRTCATGCFYVASTLISPDADPTFRINQAPHAAPAIAAPGNQVNDVGDNVAVQLALVTGTGVPAFRWDVAAGSLPTGVRITAAGLISGTVTGPPDSLPVTVRVIDGYGRQDVATFSWTVANRPTVTAPTNQATAVNTPVNLAVGTTCANTPCMYTINNGPVGLAISSTGVLSGTPTVSGTVTSSITVVDAAHVSVTSTAFTWAVRANLSVCPAAVAVPNAGFESPAVASGAGMNVGNSTPGLGWQTNDPSNQIGFWANGANVQAQNGNTPIAAQDGGQWIELNGAGPDTVYQDVATTPGQVVQWSVWHRARNVTGNADAQSSMQVQLGSVTSQSPQVSAATMSPTISDGASAWVNYAGVYAVPAGQTTTRFEVTATATSSGSITAGNFVDDATLTGTPCMAALPTTRTSTVGTVIAPFQLSASQGSGNYTWSGGGNLPAGLSLSSSGAITGTPTAVGSTPVTLTLTDPASNYQQTVSFTWTVTGPPTITTPANQAGTVGTAVTLAVASTCPDAPCAYALLGGPAGLSATSSGTIAGTPTTAATSSAVTMTVTDAAGATATTSAFSWIVRPASTVTTPSNQTGTLGTAVSITVGSSCGFPPCAYSLNGAPPGLSINSSAVISGTPTTAGAFSANTIVITDAGGTTTSSNAFAWTIYARPTVSAPSNQTTTSGAAVTVGIASTCANTPCSYAISGQPAGLSINSSGVISGTPSTVGSSPSVTIAITDAAGATAASAAFSWTITAPPTIVTPANQVSSVSAAVNLAISSTCPNRPCTFALNNGPAGLTISGTGVITGTPTTVATSGSVTVAVADAAGFGATTSTFTWTVKAAPTITSPGNLATTVGVAVTLPLRNTCANAPCTYTLSGGPAGLSIDSSGVISGTPTTAATYPNVTATITDAAGAAATTSPATAIIYARPAITAPGNQTSTVNTADTLANSGSCPNAPCTYTLAGAPSGFTISPSSGIVTGTPTSVAASSTVKITITDNAGVSADTGTFTWTVYARPAVTAPTNRVTSVSTAVNLALATSCPNSPCTYALTNGPPGLSVTSGGVVVGTTSATSAVYSGVTVTVTDTSDASTTSTSFTWAVTTTLAAAANNVGITKDANRSPGNFDGSGQSFSYESIVANSGPAAGATITVNGSTYVWPAAAGTGSADNVQASGQTIAMNISGSGTLGFLISASSGPSSGTGTITYSDGSTQSYTLTAPDWYTAQTTYVAKSSYQNLAGGGTFARNLYIVAAQVTLASTRGIAYVTLPTPTSGQLHVFSISQSPLAASFNNTGIVRNSNLTSGNFDGAGHTISYEDIITNGGPAAGAGVTAQGVNYSWPATAGLGKPDNVTATGQNLPFTGTGGTNLGFLVSASYGPASGGGLITYTDGTTLSFTLSAADWVATGSALSAAQVAFTSATRNTQTGPYSPAQPVNIDYVNVAVNSTKTIASITLPNQNKLHVFAIGYN